MGQAVARNVNVLLRTLMNTIGMLYLMFSLSWKLTLLMLMETPLTGLLQNIYDTHCQVVQNFLPALSRLGESF